MRKQLVALMTCIIMAVSLICVSVSGQFYDSGLEVCFNGESLGLTSIELNDMDYVPFRAVFEKMGAQVFYRASDRQVLALSRDGDMISHIVGTNTITKNGEQKVFDNTTVIENDGTYMPIDMLSAAMSPDGVSYDGGKIDIKKYLFNNDYHKVVKEVLDVSRNSNFYADRFQRYLNYRVKRPDYSIEEIIYRTNLGLDYPFYENIYTIENPYELLVLVNKVYKLPANFKQYNLVNMNKSYTVADGKEYLLEAGAYKKYVEMADAAKRAGLSMKCVSAYRTESYQAGLYNNKLRSTGRVNADNYSARPGHSEHQTGLAVDINSTSGSFEYTKEFKWLQEHAHEYGFIMRYPKGKEWITGYAYEPWHYRYVGTDAATIIHNSDMTYEEYYAMYVSNNEFK